MHDGFVGGFEGGLVVALGMYGRGEGGVAGGGGGAEDTAVFLVERRVVEDSDAGWGGGIWGGRRRRMLEEAAVALALFVRVEDLDAFADRFRFGGVIWLIGEVVGGI
jgi:hypothetical protein